MGSHRSLVLPAEAGDGLLRDLVAGRDAPVDAVGAVLVEGLGDRQRLGPAADTLAADVVADQGAELRGSLTEEAVERGEADRLFVALDDDRELAVLTGIVDRPPRPRFGLLERELVPLLHQRSDRRRVVEPAMDGGCVALFERTQADCGAVGAHVRNPNQSG